MSNEKYISAVRAVTNTKSAWVLFSNGTVVFLDQAQPNMTLEGQALDAIKTYGEVMAGGPAGDFNVSKHESGTSIVMGHCPYMYTMVLQDELEPGAPDMVVGLHGRGKRHQDFEQQQIIHTEPARN